MTTYLIILGGLILLILIVRFAIRIRRAGRTMVAIETAGKVVRGAVFARLANRYRQTYGPEAKALAAAVANVLFSEATPQPSPAWDFIESHPGIVEKEVKALKGDENLLSVVHAILSHEIGIRYARGVDAQSIEVPFKKLEELGLLVPTQMQLEECLAAARRFTDEEMNSAGHDTQLFTRGEGDGTQ